MSTGTHGDGAAEPFRFGGDRYWRSQFWLSLIMMMFWWILAGLSFRDGIPWLRVGPAVIFTVMLIVSGARLWQLSGVDDPTKPVPRRLELWIR